jgi:hypothetical protein
MSANPQTVYNANIPHLGLRTQLGRDHMDVVFEAGGWVAITGYSNEVTPFIRGDVVTHWFDYYGSLHPSVLPNTPLAFYFRHGAGRVLFTSFHNQAQFTDDMMNFIMYLVFSAHADYSEVYFSEWAEEEELDYFGAVYGVLNYGQTSGSFPYTSAPGDDFVLMLDPNLGDFTITLTCPAGNVFTNTPAAVADIALHTTNASAMEVVSMGSRGIRVLNPTDGEWHFTVTSGNNTPGALFAVGIAEGLLYIGDINLDGIVNAEDLFMLLRSWGSAAQADYHRADLNRDGVINAEDLFELLSRWGSQTRNSP